MKLFNQRLSILPVPEPLRTKVAILRADYDRFLFMPAQSTQHERLTKRQVVEDQLALLLNELEYSEVEHSPIAPEFRFAIGLLISLTVMATVGLLMLSQGL